MVIELIISLQTIQLTIVALVIMLLWLAAYIIAWVSYKEYIDTSNKYYVIGIFFILFLIFTLVITLQHFDIINILVV